MNVVCLKWGDKYGPEYVTRLQSMCARYLQVHRFIAFTDDPVDGVECRELPSDLPGWWAKIGLFRPGLLSGNNLYLDLDVVLTASLQPLLDAFYTDPWRLWARDDFGYSLRHPRGGMSDEIRRLLGGTGTINSSVMLWRDDHARRIWDEWRPEIMDELHGDQNHITRVLWPDGIRLLPDDMIGSYKYGDARPYPVTVFHGEPKPHQVEGWVQTAWR
jgi:hypothetical protein